MLFSTLPFIFVFLPCAWLVYAVARRIDATLGVFVLLCASLYFYASWRVEYLLLICGSIIFNYLIYKCIKSKRWRPHQDKLAAIGVTANLAILFYYKYIGFFLVDILQLQPSEIGFEIPILPLAISFFTFQQISFVLDIRRDDRDVTLLEYSAYVSFFPQLIAGPIVRYDELLPQLKTQTISYPAFSAGVILFAIGLAKKVLIADSLSGWVAIGFENGATNWSDAWLGALAYTHQLYFDFSGYSDMAIGLALMFGFQIPQNFNSPYKSLSIQDFWRRWHMTLSRWLRDYLYIGLGGNRRGSIRTYFNLFATMLLGGIWHGAGWTFVFWGALHGAALIVNRLWSRLGLSLPRVLAWGLTMLVVVVGWVFFRAESFGQAQGMLGQMFGLNGVSLPSSWAAGWDQVLLGLGLQSAAFKVSQHAIPLHAWFVVIGLSGFVLIAPNSGELLAKMKNGSRAIQAFLSVFAGIIFALCVKRLSEVSVPSEFLYFQF